MSRLQTLLGAGALSFALRGFGTGLNLLAHAAIARLAGLEEYGAFAFVYGWSLLLGIAAKFGLDRAVVRFGSPLVADGDAAGLRALAVRAGAAAAAFGSVIALAVWGLSAALTDTESLRRCFAIGALAIPLVAMHHVCLAAGQALRRPLLATAPEHLLRPVVFAALLLGCWLADRRPDGALAMQFFVAALAVSLAAETLWLRHLLPPVLAARPAPPGWLGYAWQMALVANLGAWLVQIDLVLVGVVLGSASAGLYAVAMRIAALVPWVGLSAMTLFAPLVAELSARGDRVALQARVTPAARVIAGLSSLLAAMLAIASPWLLPAVFGPEFSAALPPLLLLLAGFAMQDVFGPGAAILNMSGRPAATLRVSAVCTALALALHLLLIPRLGIFGAGLVTGAVLAAHSATLWWTVRLTARIDTSVLGGRLWPPG